MVTVEQIISTIRQKKLQPDRELLSRAYDFMVKAHEGQIRADKITPYAEHPAMVALTLAEMGLDSITIAAGLLHDVPEDTARTIDDIYDTFGQEIAQLVSGITKFSQIRYQGFDRYIESLRKMFLAASQDIRSILIKLADRKHNLETLKNLPEYKRERIAKETLEIYVPVAARLGLNNLKTTLEDLAFPYIYPREAQELIPKIIERLENKKEYLEKINHLIQIELKKQNIKFLSVAGRAKGLYSIYRKLQLKKSSLENLYDIIAMRIVVPHAHDCYKVLSIIQNLWTPLPERYKDYIAHAKVNGYQSLHTTVICEDEEIVEWQIRTEQMHRVAELGVTTHWRYKEGQLNPNRLPTGTNRWLDELLLLDQSTENQNDYLSRLKEEIMTNRIFIFTPAGDILDLPTGATAVDFAYHIHTDIGNHCAGCRINGKMSSLETILQNNDTIEIIYDKNRLGPNRDWLNFAKTRHAREQIRRALS